MADKIERQSLSTDLSGRYNSDKVGGAYDAKKAGTSTQFSPQATRYKNTGDYVINQQQGVSDFKGIDGTNYTEISAYAKNVDLRAYKK